MKASIFSHFFFRILVSVASGAQHFLYLIFLIISPPPVFRVCLSQQPHGRRPRWPHLQFAGCCLTS